MEVDVLVLHRPPQPLDEDVVVTAALPIHADAHACCFQHAREGLAGELRALVRVEDLWAAVAGQGLLQGLHAEPCFQGVGHPEGQHLATPPVQHRHQIHAPLSHGHVRNVAGPDLVGARHRHVPQQVGVHLVLGVRRGGPRPRIDGLQPHSPLVAGQGAAAVERRPQVLLVQQPHQRQVVRLDGLGPMVEARPAQPQQGALPGDAGPFWPLADHLLTPCPIDRPGTWAKKSRSTLSLPICRYNSATSTSWSFTARSRPLPTSSHARYNNSFRQAAISVGCTSNLAASSAWVCSPRTAAKATCALKSALYCLRFLLMMPTPFREWLRAYTPVRFLGTISVVHDCMQLV